MIGFFYVAAGLLIVAQSVFPGSMEAGTENKFAVG